MKKLLFLLMLMLQLPMIMATDNQVIEIRGKVTDRANNAPLSYCNILVEGTHASTVANSHGEYLIKLPVENEEVLLTFRHIGYKSRQFKAAELLAAQGNVFMEQVAFMLPQIDVLTQDADAIVRSMFQKMQENYPENEMLLTAFYRESIRKNKGYVSLSEAVVDVQKQAYQNNRDDAARLYKSRRQADYQKLDTLVFKLMGGPYNNLLLDVMKHPEIIFSEDVFAKYYFTLDKVTWMDEKLIYAIRFRHYPSEDEALYEGVLFIDANTLALRSATFSLSLENEDVATQMFIRKKPANARVTVTGADYRIDYIEKDGKWYYAYSRIELGMKINWKRKFFNTNYFSVVEMAVTDREDAMTTKAGRWKDRLKDDVIIGDAAAGFSDPGFWGVQNVIEPEKPIEAAIRKIQKQLEKR